MEINLTNKTVFKDSVHMFRDAVDPIVAQKILLQLGIDYSLKHFEPKQKLDSDIFTYNFEQLMTLNNDIKTYVYSDDFHELVSEQTGIEVSKTLSCWASAYSKGHYLTPHTDAIKDRKVAYIFYFNAEWRPHWGGNIAFEKDDHWIMIPPMHGSMMLFDVRDSKNRHMVTPVWSDETRYAITGWLV